VGVRFTIPIRWSFGGADRKDTLTTSQRLHPLTVPLKVAIARPAQTSRMRMGHAKHSQALVFLSQDATAEFLRGAVELHV
jgi:hypothetical protein